MSVQDFRTAGETHDIELAMSACAEDVVVHSPLTDSTAFRGQTEVRQLFEAVYERFDGIRYTEELGDGNRRVLFGTASVGGQRIDETLRLRLDGRGKIAEITLYVRPLPGLAAVMAALGPGTGLGSRSRAPLGYTPGGGALLHQVVYSCTGDTYRDDQ